MKSIKELYRIGTGFVAGARSHLRQLHRAAAPVRSHGVYLEPSGVACDAFDYNLARAAILSFTAGYISV